MNDGIFVVLLPTLLLAGTWFVYQSFSIDELENKKLMFLTNNQSNERVQVEFFVMSKCPDAALCEKVFLPSLIGLSSIVNFTLSFIAQQPMANQFYCPHGLSECEGNKQQLCIQNMYSPSVLIKYLLCQSAEFWSIPYNGQSCAQQTSEGIINWSNVDACVRSTKGNQLFDQSLERTRLSSAKKSCTIHLNGKLWCMHDGYWLNCHEGYEKKNFIQAICSRYKGRSMPKECLHVE